MPNLIVTAILSSSAAAAAAAVVGAAVVTTATEILVYAAFIGLTLAYSSSQQRKLRKSMAAASSGIDNGRSLMVRDPVAARQLVYGQVLKSGSISFFEVGGTNNQYLYLNIDIADHLCEELGKIYFNKEEVPLDGSGNATGKYAGYVRVNKFLGLAAGERDTTMEGELPGIWTSNHIGKNMCRLHVRLTHNPDLFAGEYPLIEVLVKGKQVYDFRTSTTYFSANWANVVADFLTDTRLGKGIATARIISADVIEAANTSDESVTLNPSGTEARYTINGVVNSDTDPDSTLLDLESAGAGCVCDPGGKWSIRAGAARTPTLDLGDGDFANTGTIEITPRQSRQDTYNGVRGQFIAPINQWAPADFPVVKNDTYMGWDGGKRLWKDVVYNFTTSPALAQRLAKIDLERGRQQIVVAADFKLKAMQCQPGDVITLTRARLGWSSKQFEVVEWALKIMDSGGGPCLVVALVLRETAAAVWDWAGGSETLVDLALNTTLMDRTSVATPSGLTLSTQNFLQNDGTITPRLKVVWTAPGDTHITSGGYVHIEYKKHADTDWTVWTTTLRGDAVFDFITDVQAGVAYDVRIRFENVWGVRGAYCSLVTATVSADTTAPGVPSSLVATGLIEAIQLAWTNPADTDFAGMDIYESTTATPAPDNTTPPTFSAGSQNQWNRTGLAAATTRYYWIRSRDYSNNVSAWIGPVYATTTLSADAISALINSVASDMSQLIASTSDHANAVLQELAQRQADIAAEAGTRAAAITSEQTTRASADSAETSARTAADSVLQTNINTAVASITSEATTRAAADTAETSARTAADSTLTTNLATANAAIATEQTTRATIDAALAADLAAMIASFNDSVASLYQEFTTRAAADTSMSSSITTLNASVGTLNSTVNILASAYIVGGVAIATWGFKLDAYGKVVGMQAIAASGGTQADTGVIIFSGADLRSDNFVAGTSGWRIRYDGTVEFQNATIRGTLNASDINAGTINSARLPSGIPSGVLGDPVITSYNTHDLTVNPPTGAPSGYTVRYSIGSGTATDYGPSSAFPLHIITGGAAVNVSIQPFATGYSPGPANIVSWNSLFL